MKLPVVVLAGRPNTGKSTLFNRLLRKRRAITDPSPGVTRDPVAVDTTILGRRLRLIDTGGFKLDRKPETPEAQIDVLVLEQTLKTIKEADLIVLVLEAGEISLEDEEFIEVLRPYQDKLIVAVNKTEGGRLEAEAWNLLSYGFEKIYPISAEHGDNISRLEDAIVKGLKFDEENNSVNDASGGDDSADSPPIRIALLGKPNTGKSTLSNRLTASAASIVSDISGTTRDVVEGNFFWKNRRFEIMDTAGIRRRAKVNENIEFYSVNRAIKTIDEADIIFLIIDAEEGLSDQDKKIASLAHDKGRGIILVLNKWDIMPQIKNAFEAARDRTHFMFGKMEYAPVLAVSAKDGGGVDTLLATAVKMYAQLNRRIETALLNEALGKWLEEYPPPIGPRTRFKIKYAVQASSNPVKFIFFASRKQAVGEPYIAYIRNRIRRDLGFSLIPVEIEIRSSTGKDE
ncbi:MAG: ribosome biogenesis GTPase Der [Treponema sp.]|jgi:GTP-binding protein|nr:ribosome biogenesis GTPase Der [Treponema sp.]